MWYRRKEKKKWSMTWVSSEIMYIFFRFGTMFMDAKSGGSTAIESHFLWDLFNINHFYYSSSWALIAVHIRKAPSQLR